MGPGTCMVSGDTQMGLDSSPEALWPQPCTSPPATCKSGGVPISPPAQGRTALSHSDVSVRPPRAPVRVGVSLQRCWAAAGTRPLSRAPGWALGGRPWPRPHQAQWLRDPETPRPPGLDRRLPLAGRQPLEGAPWPPGRSQGAGAPLQAPRLCPRTGWGRWRSCQATLSL